MNKYDEKILSITQKGVIIHELLRRPVQNFFTQIIDMLFNNILFTVDGLQTKGAYYLVTDQEKATLIHIDRELEVHEQDITEVIQQAAYQRSFIFDGHRYRPLRQIQ